MYDEEEMLSNIEYRNFKKDIDDEFEEMDFDGREHEFPLNSFSKLDMNVVDSA